MKTIEDLAGVHLGKSGDGTPVKPYVTPDKIDPTLLVAVPRTINREKYDIDSWNLPFVGYDVWNAYEVSYLDSRGFPVSGILKLVYPADSQNIVESKSLKLYLNSFNMVEINDPIDKIIENHFKEYLGIDVEARFFQMSSSLKIDNFNIDTYRNLKVDMIHHSNAVLTSYNEDMPVYSENPNILELAYNDTNEFVEYNFYCSDLRSNCRITNQPDWGDILISYYSDKEITPSSLYRYIISLRKENHFHEEICEMVYKRLNDILGRCDLFVGCFYTRRGGIDINPIRASSMKYLNEKMKQYIDITKLSPKMPRQ